MGESVKKLKGDKSEGFFHYRISREGYRSKGIWFQIISVCQIINDYFTKQISHRTTRPDQQEVCKAEFETSKNPRKGRKVSI